MAEPGGRQVDEEWVRLRRLVRGELPASGAPILEACADSITDLIVDAIAQAVRAERADTKLMAMTVRRLTKPDTPEWREAGRILERLRSTAALRAPSGEQE